MGEAKQVAAIFRDRRRYAREVALPSGVSYGCRMGVTMVFMAAFDIPVTVFTVFLVAASHTLSQLFAITPGGVGQTQALDLVTLRRVGADWEHRRVLGNPGLRDHRLERRPRRRGHALGVRLRADESPPFEERASQATSEPEGDRPQLAGFGCCSSRTRKAATMSLTPRIMAKAATHATSRIALRP